MANAPCATGFQHKRGDCRLLWEERGHSRSTAFFPGTILRCCCCCCCYYCVLLATAVAPNPITADLGLHLAVVAAVEVVGVAAAVEVVGVAAAGAAAAAFPPLMLREDSTVAGLECSS